MSERKYPAINIVELYFKGSENGWNDFLTECLVKRDVNRLARTMYRIQAGMDDAAKAKLNTDKLVIQYIRWLRSIEKTVKAIIRERYPNPRDNPLFAQNPDLAEAKWLEVKRKRDHELELFFRKASY